MTNAMQTQAPLTMTTHHCRECGEDVHETGFCAAHPNEIVDTIVSVHPLRAAVNKAEAYLREAREEQESALAAFELAGEEIPSSFELNSNEVLRVHEQDLENAKSALEGSDCPRQWALREGGYEYATITASSTEEALEEARSNVDRSNYSDCTGTLWIDVRVDCEETGERASDTVALDEDEPDCEVGETHEWSAPHSLLGGLTENPGVFGHGGGVIIHEVCLTCGCKRTTDTWAQNRETGEQGLRSVSYEEHEYTSDELDVARLETE
jgi:hypothetical protein